MKMLHTQNTLFSLNEQNGGKIDYGFFARGSSPTSDWYFRSGGADFHSFNISFGLN